MGVFGILIRKRIRGIKLLGDIIFILEENIKWNIGSVVDWVSAAGTLAALYFSLYLFRDSKKREGRVVIEGYSLQDNPILQKQPEVRIHFFNSGNIPIKITEYGIGSRKGLTKKKKIDLNTLTQKSWIANYDEIGDDFPLIVQPQDDNYLYWNRKDFNKIAAEYEYVVVFVIDSGGNSYIEIIESNNK